MEAIYEALDLFQAVRKLSIFILVQRDARVRHARAHQLATRADEKT